MTRQRTGMTEKQRIEKATVDAFVALHNETHRTSYSVREYGDAPDAACASAQGDLLNIEVCVTEDRPGDIPWLLGKTPKRSHSGKRGSCLSGNVLTELKERLNKKSLMRYGPKTALVIRDSSGVDWDWEAVKPQVQEHLQQCGNPFQMGIWIANRSLTRLHKIA